MATKKVNVMIAEKTKPKHIQMEPALISYKIGNVYPYDNGQLGNTWMLRAARGIIVDLLDRQGIKHGFEDVDLDIRIEIVGRMAEIIKLAVESEKLPNDKTE